MRLEYKSTKLLKLFSFIFILIGIAVPMTQDYSTISLDEYRQRIQSLGAISFSNIQLSEIYDKLEPILQFATLWNILTILFGYLFLYLGIKMLYQSSVPIVFDKGKNAFWKSRQKFDSVYDNNTIDDYIDLNHVYAIQLLSQYVENGSDKSY